MGKSEIRQLPDIEHGAPNSRLRLLAPLRYLAIHHPEKKQYDLLIPFIVGLLAWAVYLLMNPKPPLFGDEGLLRFARDLLVMAVPFMVGALAAVSMGAPGPHLEKRPIGAELRLDNQVLTLRQFLCYLLGYLSFVGIVTLICVVSVTLMRETIVSWTEGALLVQTAIHVAGTFVLSMLLSFLAVTVFWALYFLTDIANGTNA